MSVQSIIKFLLFGHTTFTTERSAGMKVFIVIMIIVVIFFALILLDIFMGRAGYRKKAYEPVFSKRRVTSN